LFDFGIPDKNKKNKMEDPHRCIQDFVQALGAKSHFFHPPS
jgi:hypothetical protein